MRIQLSDHFTYKKLIKFTFPCISMMIFTSIYSVVDGFFISNFAGKTPFAAANFAWPFVMMLSALGFMFGTGGSAIVAKTLGEGKKEKANEYFSLFVYTSIGLGIVVMVLGLVFLRPVMAFLGAEGAMLDDAVLYGRILLYALPFFMIQMEFQSFFVTAERPGLGFWSTVIAGVINMVCDWLFVAVFSWGLIGAAWATACSQMVGGLIPLIYFSSKNHSLLRFSKASWDGRILGKACTNGSSEFLNNISMSIVSMLYNVQLMRYAGEDGVAAYGVLMYVCLVFLAIYIGYGIGMAPIVGFHYGAGNTDELKSLLRKSLILILAASLAMLGMGEVLARPLSLIFVGYDQTLLDITARGFTIYSFSFLFSGLGIFGSAFFTALSDGVTSAIISVLRTLVFQMAAVLILPLIWGLDGIWYSIIVAEALATMVTFIFLKVKQKRFGY